jgi:hypothetical protein
MSSSSSSSRAYSNPLLHVLTAAKKTGGSEEQKSSKTAAAAGGKASGDAYAERMTFLSSQLVSLLQTVCADYASSASSSRADPFLYEGVGGVAFTLVYCSRRLRALQQQESQQPPSQQPSTTLSPPLRDLLSTLPTAAVQWSDSAAQLYAHAKHSSSRLTFFMGSAGVHVTRILAALNNASTQSQQPPPLNVIEESIQALQQLMPKPMDASLPDEILYGRAGSHC